MSDEIDSKSKRYDIEVYIWNKSLVEYIEKYL
jgi:hypothetical protein